MAMNVVLDYHQPAFDLLHKHLADRLRDALLIDPVAIRARYLTKHLPVGQVIRHELGWPIARQLLNVLEDEIAAMLRPRSVFFWLHIYRRIGVFLNPEHEDKSDPRTLWLVRQIVELAISKHGRATDADEFVLSTRVNPDLILGGFMRAGVRALATSRPNRAYRNFANLVRSHPQLVIRDFSEEDFVGIYRVEGLAYQYWRVTALLRALGKGARAVISNNGDWTYVQDDELSWLMTSIDERTEQGRSDRSLLGIWIDEEVNRDKGGKKPVFDLLICPVYNVHGAAFQQLGLALTDEYISNFLPAVVDVRTYLQAHSFLSDAFRARYGFGLEAFVAVLWAIANILYFPRAYIFAEAEQTRRKLLRDTLLNVLQRGYRIFEIGADHVVPELRRRIKLFGAGLEITEAEIRAVLDRLTLTPASQTAIALWSGGPRHVMISAGQHQAADLQGVPVLLGTLFVRVVHDQGYRGAVFEDAFRRALEIRKFAVWSGRLRSTVGGLKEMDAGVIVGRILYAFECVSVERPLDYEIGNPVTLANRRERLDGKVSQVLELAEFLETNPRGMNYDFTDIQKIVPLVVSPFEEWLWDRSVRLWLSDGTPRILSATEALDMLERVRGNGRQQ
jgi:hypothetical protein